MVGSAGGDGSSGLMEFWFEDVFGGIGGGSVEGFFSEVFRVNPVIEFLYDNASIDWQDVCLLWELLLITGLNSFASTNPQLEDNKDEEEEHDADDRTDV